jgi:hypothetical protein
MVSGADFAWLHHLFIDGTSASMIGAQVTAGTNITIENCRVNDVLLTGVNVAQGAAVGLHTRILNNHIDGSATGINFAGSDSAESVARYNQISGCTTGVVVAAGALKVQVTDNRFSGNTTNWTDAGTNTNLNWNTLDSDTSGVVKSNLAQILGTAFTETSGQIAAAFKKLFNVATPTAQADNLPLNTDYTSARATKLDNLDATVSSRSTLGGVAQTADNNTLLTTIAGYIDTEVGTINTNVATILADYARRTGDYATVAALASVAANVVLVMAKTDNLPSGIKKNTALSNFEFLMVSSTDHVTSKTGLTITSTRSIDGGAFAATTNTATELSGGWYKINLSAADLNGDIISFEFTSALADSRTFTVKTNT